MSFEHVYPCTRNRSTGEQDGERRYIYLGVLNIPNPSKPSISRHTCNRSVKCYIHVQYIRISITSD